MKLELETVIEWHVTLACCVAALSAVSGVGSPLSVLAGATWAIANVALWALLVRALIAGWKNGGLARRARWLAAGVLLLKLFLFLAVGAALWAQVGLDPMSFAGGIAIFTLALVAMAVRASRGVVLREA